MWVDGGYLEALPGHRHVVIDHRGHGRSDSPRAADAHRLDEYVADVLAVLDQLLTGPAVFVGYSAGATVGFGAVAAAPSRILGLVTLGSAPDGPEDVDESQQLVALVRERGTRSLMAELASAEREPPPAWFLDHLSATEPEMFALLVEQWALTPDRPWDDLPLVRVPTLVVTGEQECSDATSDATVRRLPRGRAVRLPGFGHLQVFWRSDVVAPLVADFVSTLTDSQWDNA
jgi:pimeloyl-ACP methyl ester carboxylesterase